VSRQQTSTDTRRAPILAPGGIDILPVARIKRNAVAVEICKDSPKGYEKSGLDSTGVGPVKKGGVARQASYRSCGTPYFSPGGTVAGWECRMLPKRHAITAAVRIQYAWVMSGM
jgi:hypothetical protein